MFRHGIISFRITRIWLYIVSFSDNAVSFWYMPTGLRHRTVLECLAPNMYNVYKPFKKSNRCSSIDYKPGKERSVHQGNHVQWSRFTSTFPEAQQDCIVNPRPCTEFHVQKWKQMKMPHCFDRNYQWYVFCSLALITVPDFKLLHLNTDTVHIIVKDSLLYSKDCVILIQSILNWFLCRCAWSHIIPDASRNPHRGQLWNSGRGCSCPPAYVGWI